jgi:valacyclovir hydrolase
MPFVDLATGAKLHYVDTGGSDSARDGAFIAIHGMLGTAERHMGRVIDWLCPRYRVLGPTLRGYGQSGPKPRTFPYDFYQQDAADVLAFMDALEIDRAHLLGYSDGGEVALLAAGYAPERFRSVMTIGAVGYFGPAMRPTSQALFPGSWITTEERALHGIDNADAFALGWVRAALRIIDSGGDLSLSLAEKISAPLLMMLGETDRLNPAAYAQKLVERAPNARLRMFACGHAIHDEAWDEFRRVVDDFLREVETSADR